MRLMEAVRRKIGKSTRNKNKNQMFLFKDSHLWWQENYGVMMTKYIRKGGYFVEKNTMCSAYKFWTDSCK